MAKSIKEVRIDYQAIAGKKPFNGWDIKELNKRIKEAKKGSEGAVTAVKPLVKLIKAIIHKIFKINFVVKKKGKLSGLFLNNGRAIYTAEYITTLEHNKIMKALDSLDLNGVMNLGHVRKRGPIERHIKQTKNLINF